MTNKFNQLLEIKFCNSLLATLRLETPVEPPALNKKGGLRFQLSYAWDEAIRRLPRRLSRDQSEAR